MSAGCRARSTSSRMTVAEKDSIKAMTLKIGNQLTRKSFQGVLKLTHGRMEIGYEYVTGRILERAPGLSFPIYDCCANACACFTGNPNNSACVRCEMSRDIVPAYSPNRWAQAP